MTGPLLSTDRASFQYPGRGAAVGPFSLDVHPGEFHLVSGPSGGGKSTLARMLSGVIPHLYRGCLHGQVRIDGRRSEEISLHQITQLVGLVSQNPAAQLLASTVEDEIIFGLENLGLAAAEIARRVRTALTCFGLQPHVKRDPRTLSGGEQQKLVLAATAARRPKVLVLDEPLSMLDTASAFEIVGHLDRLRAGGTAVVAFEHRRAAFAGVDDLKRTELASEAASSLSRKFTEYSRSSAVTVPPLEEGDAGGFVRGRHRVRGQIPPVPLSRRGNNTRPTPEDFSELPTQDTSDDARPELPERVPAFRFAVEGLGVELGGRPVLRGIDLALAGGQVLALVGANGAGKTTLLRALTGLQKHSGRITGYASGSRLAPRLGLCFQNPDRQIFNPTVKQEILFGCRLEDESPYRSVVEMLGLAAYEDAPPLLLSEGEKKRLALAIMLLRPGLCGVCLDEPTLGQDENNRRRLGQIVKRLARAGYLCLIATHDLEWALEWCDQLLLLRDGQLIASGAPGAIAGRQESWEQTGLLLPEALTSGRS